MLWKWLIPFSMSTESMTKGMPRSLRQLGQWTVSMTRRKLWWYGPRYVANPAATAQPPGMASRRRPCESYTCWHLCRSPLRIWRTQFITLTLCDPWMHFILYGDNAAVLHKASSWNSERIFISSFLLSLWSERTQQNEWRKKAKK